jgi:hypothetical protein
VMNFQRMSFLFNSLMFRFLIIALLLSSFAGCSPSRHLSGEQYLLQKNKIVIKDAQVSKEDLKSLVRQKPNRRILGIYRFHLNVYQFADRRGDTRFFRWMKNTVGEPPVIYQPQLTGRTNRQFELFMHNKGYFNSTIDTIIRKGNNKVWVTYHITGNAPYHIRNIQYRIADQHLEGFIVSDTVNSLIKRGSRHDADILQNERERLTRHLRNNGFYTFNREFITFELDSSLGSRQLDVTLIVHNPRRTAADTIKAGRHKRYIIDNIYIFPDHTPLRPTTTYDDTTVFLAKSRDRQVSYFFLHNSPLRIRQRALVQNILLDQGRYFRVRDVEQTYNYLSGLRNFRFINIGFSPANNPLSGLPSDSIGFLNANIQLSRAPANAYTIEAEGINSSGNLGIAGNLLFQNRNMFRGAEILNLRLKAALEVTDETNPQGSIAGGFPFNTMELSAEASMDFPKLLFPVPMERISKNARPKSTVLSGINYRQRPDYTRYILNISYGFEWSENPLKRHFLNPLEISTIKIFNDSILQSNIPQGNPLILSRFKDHLITGSKYSYIYNAQMIGSKKNFLYFRVNLESAGNLLNLATRIIDTPIDENGSKTIFNIPFAQYLKADADFRHYWMLDNNSSLVFRAMAGVGVPYGNTTVLPFIKSYYGGGANGIRAWKIYSLGPGGHQDTLNVRFDRYGDIKLEANLEYRFPIYSFWHGAFFLDAGNVWFIDENPQFPNGSFAADRFYREIALGTGFGLRMDFGFFVIRVDLGLPLRDPGNPYGQKWIASWPGTRDFNLNLGIGYPF